MFEVSSAASASPRETPTPLHRQAARGEAAYAESNVKGVGVLAFVFAPSACRNENPRGGRFSTGILSLRW